MTAGPGRRDGKGEDPGGDGAPGGPGPDPRADRFDALGRWLGVGLWATVLATLLAVLVGGAVGDAFGTAAIVVLVAVPLARVAWFVLRWARRGDRRYALVGAGVLLVVAVGTAIGWLTA